MRAGGNSANKENTIVSIEEDANQDLALSDEDAEGVAGGHKAAKHSHAAARTEPLMIKQDQDLRPHRSVGQLRRRRLRP